MFLYSNDASDKTFKMLKSKHKTGSVIWGAGLFVAPTNGRLCFFLANFIKNIIFANQ